mmetsp:Transcript_51868/g.91112  ORF Transcript_51868/g.91112 Transcript_51868/m.91112 type:complete len:185 (+) Transcript_51868:59-613(+)
METIVKTVSGLLGLNPEPPDPKGAYLTWDETGMGSLVLVWSNTKIEGALAFFAPTKAVPKFKFNPPSNKMKLVQEIQKRPQALYTGWVQFVKEGMKYDSTFFDFGSGTPKPAAIWLHYPDNTIKKVPTGSMFEIKGCDAVAACHSDKSELDVPTLDKKLFVEKGQLDGYATGVGASGSCMPCIR